MIIGDTPAQLGQIEAANAMMIDGKIVTRDDYRALTAQVEALQRSAVPNEHGKNRYGLDVAYFRNVINRELNRSLMDFNPSELARVFARLSRTADDSVLLENEFIGEHLRELRAEAIEQAATYLAESIPDKSHESVIFKDRYVYISTRCLREYAESIRQGGAE